MAKGGGGTSTTVSQSEPWKEQKPYLQSGFQRAEDLYNSSNPQWYNFDTTVPYSPQTMAALDWQQKMALGGMGLGSQIDAGVNMGMGAPTQQGGGRGSLEYDPSRNYGAVSDTTLPPGLRAAMNMNGGGGGGMMPGMAGGDIMGGGLPGAAMAANQQLMGGGQNPYLDRMFQQGADALATNFRNNVNPQIQSYYEKIGGSPMNPSMMQGLQSAQKQQYTDPMTALATQMYGGAYENDQNRRLQALGMAPQTYELGYAPAEKLGQVGAAQESKSLEQLQQQMAQWDFNQNRDLDKLNQYMNLIGGANWGGTSTTTGPNPYASNPYGDIGSAAMMGMALPKMFGV